MLFATEPENPHILDRVIIDHALDNFEEYHACLPGLVSKYEVIKVELSPQDAKDTAVWRKYAFSKIV